MKALIILFAPLFTANIASAQVFSGLGMGTEKTFNMEAGILFKDINAQASFGGIISYYNTSRPNLVYLNFGYRVKLGDELKFTATPSIGIARVTFMQPYQVIKSSDQGQGHAPKTVEIENINSHKLIYSLEIGKEVGISRLYMRYTRAGSYAFYSAGFKVFIREFYDIGSDPGSW